MKPDRNIFNTSRETDEEEEIARHKQEIANKVINLYI